MSSTAKEKRSGPTALSSLENSSRVRSLAKASSNGQTVLRIKVTSMTTSCTAMAPTLGLPKAASTQAIGQGIVCTDKAHLSSLTVACSLEASVKERNTGMEVSSGQIIAATGETMLEIQSKAMAFSSGPMAESTLDSGRMESNTAPVSIFLETESVKKENGMTANFNTGLSMWRSMDAMKKVMCRLPTKTKAKTISQTRQFRQPQKKVPDSNNPLSLKI